MNIIDIPGEPILAELDEHGWWQGGWTGPDGQVCAHEAIRRCERKPGDFALVLQVANQQGWGASWNDNPGTTERKVRAQLAGGVHIDDETLAKIFGPQWRAIVSLVRTMTSISCKQMERVKYTRDATEIADWLAAWLTTRVDAWDTTRDAVRVIAWDATRDAVRIIAMTTWDTMTATGISLWDILRNVTLDILRNVTLVVTTWDMVTPDGPYTPAMRDVLMGPWAAEFGLPEGLVEP